MKRILVVDDDKSLLIVLRDFLENQGYMVQEVSSGVEALASLSQNLPDLVVSDVIMPEMDGLEFCRRLRSTRAGQLIPFIFLSGRGELDDRIQGHQIGADDYLIKPVNPRELVAKIETQLERSRRINAEIVRLMQSVSIPELNAPLLSSDNSVNVKSSSTLDALPLTPAEQKVFWEVIQGFTNKQISDRLFISPRTVQTHLSKILAKLCLENRSQLVRFAFEHGYRPPA